MKTISDEIREFLQATGIKQRELSRASGVPESTISNLLRGKRKHVFGNNQDSIRKAIRDLGHLSQDKT